MTSEVSRQTLLHNGTIHSIQEPYADAMLVHQGTVAWLGSEETAQARMAEATEVTDLQRGLVAPSFVGYVGIDVDQAQAPGISQVFDVAAGRLGYGVLRLELELHTGQLGADREVTVQQVGAVLAAAAKHPVQVYPVLGLRGVAADGGAPSISAVNDLLDLADEVTEQSREPIGVVLDFSEVRPNLLGVRSWCAEAGRQLLLKVGGAEPTEVVEAMVTTQNHLRQLRQTPAADTPTVLVGFDSAAREDWEELLNTSAHVLSREPIHLATALSVGVPTSAAPPEGANPWQLIAQHVHRDQDAVSVRASFNAQTRGAYRSLPSAAVESGQLNTGSAANYSVWAVDSLTVQTPHETAAAWSTDTRARTPLLPFLPAEAATGQQLPRLEYTVINGEAVA